RQPGPDGRPPGLPHHPPRPGRAPAGDGDALGGIGSRDPAGGRGHPGPGDRPAAGELPPCRLADLDLHRGLGPRDVDGVPMTEGAQTVLSGDAIEAALASMADEICARTGDGPWAVVGIRRGGENLARRLAALMAQRTAVAPPL